MSFKLDGLNDLKIITFVCVHCSANFQIIVNNLYMLWAFSIRLSIFVCMDISYIDVCVCLVWRREFYNLHPIAILLYEFHNGLLEFEIL